jgi:hypothetical protein
MMTYLSTRAAYWDLISNECLCRDFTDRMNQFSIKTVYRLPEITDDPGAATDQGKRNPVPCKGEPIC